MPDIRIDGQGVSVPDGATVLDAARRIGIEIPTLCHLEGFAPSSSCLLCVVRVNGSNRFLPSCATAAEEGMEVESDSDEVHAARRTALELLLADHLGECLAPCERICPLDLDIPRLTQLVGADDHGAAIAHLRRALPFPGVLGWVCPAKCEAGCRRRSSDDPVSVRNIERHLADRDREGGRPTLPECRPDTGRRVAGIGGGPAGLSAAYFLRVAGHGATVFERRERIGGRLRHAYEADDLPTEMLDEELSIVARLGAEIRCDTVAAVPDLLEEFDAVLVAAADVPGAADHPDAFFAGDSERPIDDPVRAMASGRDAAAAIDARLSGREAGPAGRRFSTVVGRLTIPEMSAYLENAGSLESVGKFATPSRELTGEQVSGESERCLLCACAAADTCLLKRYGEDLGANPRRFRVKRRLFVRNLDHPFVVYEPGKCIACGICVTLTDEMAEDLGLTFIGRGFDVRIGVPFDAPLRDALRQAAERVVTHCPTGALARRDRHKS